MPRTLDLEEAIGIATIARCFTCGDEIPEGELVFTEDDVDLVFCSERCRFFSNI
jgi:predicted nucleic acid-binding Zn ribbon protein